MNLEQLTLEEMESENEYNQLSLYDVINEYEIATGHELGYIAGLPYYSYKRLIWNAIQKMEIIPNEELDSFYKILLTEDEELIELPEDFRLTERYDFFPPDREMIAPKNQSYYSKDYNPESEEEPQEDMEDEQIEDNENLNESEEVNEDDE